LIINAYESDSDYSEIPGVSFISDGNIQRPCGAGLVPDINELPFPARHLLPMYDYRTSAVRTRHFPAYSMITSRGCPLKCTFCYNKMEYRRKVRYLDAERKVNEMEYLINEYGAKEIHFWDDNFILNKSIVEEFCEEMENRKLKIPFDIEVIIHAANRDFVIPSLERLKKLGLYSVSFGIESGTQRMLDFMDKKTDLDTIRRVVNETRKVGLDVRGYFLIGFPSETKDEILETIDFSKSIKLDYATFSVLIPLPGTPLFDIAKKEPQFHKEYWKEIVLSEISFPKPPLIYHPADVSEKELIELHRKACNNFYMRPSQLIKKSMRALHNKYVLKESVKGFVTLMKGAHHGY